MSGWPGAREYLDQPGLRGPLARARERIERLGRPGGMVQLGALSEAEASALGGLLGSLRRRRRPRPGEPFRLALADLDSALRDSRFELGLEQALALVGGPLDPLAARRARERDAVDAFWREALAHPLCAREPATRRWVERLRATGALARTGRASLVAVSGSAAASGRATASDSATPVPAMSALALEALDLGARLPASPPIERGRLACLALGGDPHALDEGCPLAGLLIGQLAARAGAERPREARARRRLWERFGVLSDPVSADVLTLGLRPLRDGPLASALALLEGRHFRLTLGQLAAEPLRFEATAAVHLCENPAVVVAAETELGSACGPLVCVGGWPSSAADALLAGLAEQGAELLYHGDFDWEGLRIAALVRRRYGARPWRYDAASYRSAIVDHGEHAMLLEGRPASGADRELAAAMLERGAGLHEEAVLDELVEDLGLVRRDSGGP